jgi:hypothetical protein
MEDNYMALVLAIIGGLVYSTTDSYQAYAARSNGNPAFKITLAPNCEEGARTSGYALSLRKTVFLKQRNHDGTIGDICND